MRITLGNTYGGNLSNGGDREADIFAAGETVGTLTIRVCTDSGHRFGIATVWPKGISRGMIQREFKGTRGRMEMVEWVAEELTAARSAR